jgi:hypothetical protein
VGTLNDDLFDQLTGRVSLPFEPGEHRRIAVKVIDQRGNEVMRVGGGDLVSSRLLAVLHGKMRLVKPSARNEVFP